MAASKKTPAKKTASPKAAPKKLAAKAAAPKGAGAKPAAAAKPAAPKKPAAKKGPEPAVRAAPAVGQPAPDFTLVADDGREVKLSSLRGKNVVLYFYPKDDTPGCTMEACGFRDSDRALKKAGAVVLGVSRDPTKAHVRFKEKYELPFTLLSDPEAEVIASYGSWGDKKFMGREFKGILRTTVIIDREGKVAKVFPKVSPKTHADEVLEALKALD